MTIMPKTVLFSDGEGLEFADLNNMQRFAEALIGDGIVGCAAPQLELNDAAGMRIEHLYAFGVSGAPFENVTGTRTPNFLAGLVAQQVASGPPDGNDSQVLLYYLANDEPSVARPAAVTNPRWDVVSILLAQANADSQSRDFEDASTRAVTTTTTNKQRRVEATITWTQGAENASPVEPSIPAGHVKLAAFRVVPAATLFDPETDIRDYRMPIGPVTSLVSQWQYAISQSGTSDWAQLASGHISTFGAASNETIFSPCPVTEVKRLIAVAIHRADGTGTSTTALTRRVESSTDTVLKTITADLPSSSNYSEYDILGQFGTPLWANGYAAGYAVERAATNRTSVRLRFVADGVTTPMVLGVTRWRFVG